MVGSIASGRTLVYRHEPTLFAITLVISLIVWMVLIVGTLGLAFIYVLFGFILYLFIQSAFISYIKGTGVRITQEQFPDLHERIAACSKKLELNTVPDAYLLHANGVFNALATRFLGRNFIVLYADIVDALEERPESLNFYIGHELGHIKRGHLTWGPWLWPAGWLPLIGAGYSRAREYTCDLHGAACCAASEDARRALAALAAGGSRWKSINLNAYSDQNVGGFWMSFNELVGDYPWLVKRMLRIDPATAHRVTRRNPLAWFLALFVPRLGAGGSALIFVAIIGIVAAVAIPAYADYMARVQVTDGLSLAAPAKSCVEEFYASRQTTPVSNEDCDLAPPDQISSAYTHSVAIDEGGMITVQYRDTGVAAGIAGATVVLQAELDDQGNLSWNCQGGTLAAKYRPSSCRAPTE